MKQTTTPAGQPDKKAVNRDYLYSQRPYTRDNLLGFGDEELAVQVIPSATAKALIKANHYSKKVVNNSYVHLGVHWHEALSGCLQFGYLKNPACAGSIVEGTTSRQCLELNRMWLSDDLPHGIASKVLSYSIKYIRRAYPEVQWIQSFADERCNKFGLVYQAANFSYCGEHKTPFYKLDGEWYHVQAATQKNSKGRPLGPHTAYYQFQQRMHEAERHTFRQFRYIYFLTDDARRRLKKRIQMAPKAPSNYECMSVVDFSCTEK